MVTSGALHSTNKNNSPLGLKTTKSYRFFVPFRVGNLIDLKDVDGKPFVKERVELAQSKGTFWQDYKFTNPVSKKIEPKQMYCEKLDDTVVCGGIYK